MSTPTHRRLEQHAGELSTAAVHQMEASYQWYQELSASDRSWVGLVAQAGIAAFISWHSDQSEAPSVATDVFGSAPRDLMRTVTLRQTLDLVRTVIDVVEQHVGVLAAPGEEIRLREAVLTYSREIAFGAAQVYAAAAESRGAWDARLESLVVDAILRGEADESLASRVSALGWDEVHDIVVVVGTAPAGPGAETVDSLRREALRRDLPLLAAVQRRRLIAIIGGVDDVLAAVSAITSQWADGPVVIGPKVPHLYAAGRSARAALAGQGAAPAWPEAPRPCLADELLPERALAGDTRARRRLVDKVARTMADHPALYETATAYLDQGSLEATARLLFVHPNTVRYRLGRIHDLTDCDLTRPREAFTVRLALAISHLPDL
ncbi:helix-turn-helix domain-containing protein [Allobranchiibius sp. CTAmp26]|uniref:PucR family transcriptional regulator n=1 Tax=Allobranchiibius sp. CTAmp26 TaxID=2815214 RepID=UPI0027DBD033|nr:helix-turn-helix domain-containing protein [Allobranchiibius sp. CTAmp26]